MTTQSISSVASVTNSMEGSVAQRQSFAVDVAEIETPENEVELSQGAIENVVSQINAYVQNTQREMDFRVDNSTGDVVVEVVDTANQEVIRQIPSEDMLELSRHFVESREQEEMKGFLVELKA